jgi:hypothetical protein
MGGAQDLLAPCPVRIFGHVVTTASLAGPQGLRVVVGMERWPALTQAATTSASTRQKVHHHDPAPNAIKRRHGQLAIR